MLLILACQASIQSPRPVFTPAPRQLVVIPPKPTPFPTLPMLGKETVIDPLQEGGKPFRSFPKVCRNGVEDSATITMIVRTETTVTFHGSVYNPLQNGDSIVVFRCGEFVTVGIVRLYPGFRVGILPLRNPIPLRLPQKQRV